VVYALSTCFQFYKTRQQLVVKSTKRPLLDESQTLQEANIDASDELEVIDLGPQLPWKFAMLVEYVSCGLLLEYMLPNVLPRLVHWSCIRFSIFFLKFSTGHLYVTV